MWSGVRCQPSFVRHCDCYSQLLVCFVYFGKNLFPRSGPVQHSRYHAKFHTQGSGYRQEWALGTGLRWYIKVGDTKFLCLFLVSSLCQVNSESSRCTLESGTSERTTRWCGLTTMCFISESFGKWKHRAVKVRQVSLKWSSASSEEWSSILWGQIEATSRHSTWSVWRRFSAVRDHSESFVRVGVSPCPKFEESHDCKRFYYTICHVDGSNNVRGRASKEAECSLRILHHDAEKDRKPCKWHPCPTTKIFALQLNESTDARSYLVLSRPKYLLSSWMNLGMLEVM